MIGAYLHLDGEVVSIEETEHREWVAFVSKFVDLDDEDRNDTWTLVDRCELLNYVYREAKEGMIVPDFLTPLIKPVPVELAD